MPDIKLPALPRQQRDDPDRPAGRRGDDSVPDGNVREPRQPQPQLGWAAREAVEVAREEVADLIGASAKEIVFTSGAESDNLAIKGVARFYEGKGKHIVTAATEHKAILDACHAMERDGWEVTYLDVDDQGSSRWMTSPPSGRTRPW